MAGGGQHDGGGLGHVPAGGGRQASVETAQPLPEPPSKRQMYRTLMRFSDAPQ